MKNAPILNAAAAADNYILKTLKPWYIFHFITLINQIAGAIHKLPLQY
jgi:hypothetical protein